MTNSEHHTMVVAKRYENGSEEWVCPTCGRRFLLQWPPQYKRIMLEPGNEDAVHSGGSGGVSMGDTSIIQISEEELAVPPDDIHDMPYDSPEDERYLGPWADFIDTLDL